MQRGDILGHELMGRYSGGGKRRDESSKGRFRVVVPFPIALRRVCFFLPRTGLSSLCGEFDPNALWRRKGVGPLPGRLFGYCTWIGG